MADDQPTADAEGFGLKVRTKGYRIDDLLKVLVLVALFAIAFMLREHDLTARAAHLEQDKKQGIQAAEQLGALKNINQTLIFNTCIQSQPIATRNLEFNNENSFCARIAKMR